MKKTILILFVFSFSASAAVKNKSLDYQVDSVLDQLKLPHKNRIQSLRKTNQSFEALRDISEDSSQTLQDRWRAITALGELYPEKALKTLESHAESKEWFRRNAALIAFRYTDRKHSLKWSQRLLNDRSLVVRTAAVETIAKIKGIELQGLLWEALSDSKNFRKKQSLWIRGHIAEALAQFAKTGEEPRFVKMLLDSDNRLHKPAVRALRKLTGQSQGQKMSLNDRRLAWIRYYKDKL